MIIDLFCLAIGMGVVVSLLFSEALGKAAGGLVVPGYLALHLTRPLDIFLTILAAALTYGIVYYAGSVIVIYGKRRTAAMILVGFLLGAAARYVALQFLPLETMAYAGVAVIGFIIPGLIAIWFDRQGLLDTCTSMLTASALVRLALILFASSQLRMFEIDHAPQPAPQSVAQTAAHPGER